MKHGGDLLSREVLGQLGVLPPEFPKVGQFGPCGTAEKSKVDKVSIGADGDKETVKLWLFLFLEPVTSILLGYKVDGLMSEDGPLVVWVVEHVDVILMASQVTAV